MNQRDRVRANVRRTQNDTSIPDDVIYHEPGPPSGAPNDMRANALALSQRRRALNLQRGRVTADQGLPNRAFDSVTYSVVRALCNRFASGDAAAQQLAAALKFDVTANQTRLAVQDEAYRGYLDATALYQGASDGQRLTGAARFLARAAVRSEALSALPSLPAQEATAVRAVLVEIKAQEDRQAAETQGNKALRDKAVARTDAQLGDAQSRQQLMSVLAALRRGETPDWDALAQAGQTLDDLIGAGDDTLPTPAPASSASDRRDALR